MSFPLFRVVIKRAFFEILLCASLNVMHFAYLTDPDHATKD